MSLVTSTPTQKKKDPLNRAFYLPRLSKEFYQGDAVVFWTLTIFDRATGWWGPIFHQEFRELMHLGTVVDNGFIEVELVALRRVAPRSAA